MVNRRNLVKVLIWQLNTELLLEQCIKIKVLELTETTSCLPEIKKFDKTTLKVLK